MTVSESNHESPRKPVLSGLQNFWRRYRRNRAAVLGVVIIIVLFTVGIFSDLISPYDPYAMSSNILSPPSWTNIMGTDDLGRDIFSQTVHGARVSLIVGFLASILSAIVGILVGATSGYLGGYVDDLLMRVCEAFQIIPRFFLALFIVALFGPSLLNIIFVIGVLGWPIVARVVRVEVMSLKESAYVEAARTVGESPYRILFSEILPGAIPSVLVVGSLQVASAILLEASLGFLGLSDPSIFSWGRTLNNAVMFLRVGWWIGVFPGLAIFLSVLGLNLVGDGLTDYFNPRLKER